MVWACLIVFVIGGVWAAESFSVSGEAMEFVYNLHQEPKEIRLSNVDKRLEDVNEMNQPGAPAPWSSSKVCCWDAPSWPMLPSPKLPTFPPPLKTMPTLAKPFIPSVALPTWAPLRTAMVQFPTLGLPQLTLRVPTYPPFKPMPPIKYPTWTQGFPALAPYNTVFNYSWPVPTYPPLKPLPLSPVFQLPYYPPLKYDAIPNNFQVTCPCRNQDTYTKNLLSSDKPKVTAFNINDVVLQSDAKKSNYWSQIEGDDEDIPYVKINATSVDVNGSPHKFVNMEVPSQSISSTQLFDVGNTETINSVTIVVLNNCEKAKSDVQCAGKSAFNYGPSKDQNELENGVDDGAITDVLSALLQQVSLLDNENLYLLSNDQHSVSTLDKDSLATVISSLKPDGISGAASDFPVDLFQMFGMPAVKESLKQVLPSTPGKGGSEKPVFATTMVNENAFVGRQASGAVSPPKTDDSKDGSSTQTPKPASSGTDSAASQVTIPGSVGVEDSRSKASSTVKPSLSETSTNSTVTEN